MAAGREKGLILTLRTSRRSFLLEYSCALLLFALWLAAGIKQINIPSEISYLMLGLAVAAVGSAEFIRMFGDRYLIMDDKLVMINGFMRLKQKNVYYQALGFVPDFNVKQSVFQRMLNYGTIFVSVSSEDFEIRNVADPNNILELLEKLIQQSTGNVTPDRLLGKSH